MYLYTASAKPFLKNLIQRGSSGFTLLEVIVTIFIVAIGLLGLAGLQVIGLRLSGDSNLRTAAAILANDMIDRMRANETATSLGVNSPYNNPTGTTTPNSNCLGLNNAGGYINTTCTPTQMAGEDFYEWYAALRGTAATSWYPAVPAALPSGAGVVCVDSTPEDGTPGSPSCDNNVLVPGKVIFAIKIWWIERQDPHSPGTTHSYVTNFSL